jgi:hypothetical protein
MKTAGTGTTVAGWGGTRINFKKIERGGLGGHRLRGQLGMGFQVRAHAHL